MPKLKQIKPNTTIDGTKLKYIRDAGWYVSPGGSRKRLGTFICLLDKCENEKDLDISAVKSKAWTNCGKHQIKTINYEPGYISAGTHLKFLKEIEPKVDSKGRRYRWALYKCMYDNCGNFCNKPINLVKRKLIQRCGKHVKIIYQNGTIINGTFLEFIEELAPKTNKSGAVVRQALFKCIFSDCNKLKTYSINAVNGRKSGIKSCGNHKNPTQRKIYEELILPIFPDAIYEFCLPNRQRCDIFIPSLNLVIEYQGEQHYQTMWYDKGDIGKLKIRQARDRRKSKLVKALGYKMYKISEYRYIRNRAAWNKKIVDYLKTSTSVFS